MAFNRSRASALALLRRFENAVRTDEMRGCMHPDDRDDIHQHYRRARERMIKHLLGE